MRSVRAILHLLSIITIFPNILFCQINKYSDYEKKGVTYNEKITYRYILKRNRFNSIHEIDSSQVDTISNNNGSIKSVTRRYEEIYSSADYDYPDSTLYERQVYDGKGLLVYNEERYHIHVDQPCFTQTYYLYDKYNRQIQKDVLECDSFFHKRITSEFDDKLRTVKETLFDKKNNYLEYWIEIKFDSLGRREKMRLMQEEGGKTEEWGRTEYSYETRGKAVIGKIYERNKLNKIHYWLYNKKGRLVSELECWPDTIFDTLVSAKFLLKYDRKGNLVQKNYGSLDSKSEINYTYDKKNRLIAEKESHETRSWDEKITRWFYKYEYYYRKDGLMDYMDVFKYDGEQLRYRYEYKFKP